MGLQKISIATWNINSINARIHAIEEWIKTVNPTIIMLQETKCQDKNFPISEFNFLGYNVAFVGQKSYNGVAILSKYPIEIEYTKLPIYDEKIADEEARYIEGVVNIEGTIFRIASVYIPNGSSDLQGCKLEDSARFKYKLSFFRRLQKRMQELRFYQDEKIIFGGDYNVAMTDKDLFNPKSALGGVGFHDSEKSMMKDIFNSGYVDSFRLLNPDAIEYSWWDYRHKRWLNNKGWRIDYLLSSLSVVDFIQECKIHKDTRGKEKPSDHVPVELLLKLK